MRSFIKVNPMWRAIGVISAVAVIATGVTFAALNSQATLTSNTISSASADLQVDNTDNGAGLGTTDVGYVFSGIVPGGAGSNVGNFQLRNNGTADMTVKVSVPAAPTFTVVGGVNSVDNTKVHVLIQRGAGAVQDILLSDLLAAPQTISGGNLSPNTTENFTVQVKMDATAFSGTSVSSTGFSFQFDGTGV